MKILSRRVLFYLINCICLVLSVFWISLIVSFHCDFPYADDFDVCLRFVNELIETKKLTLFFQIHNEHCHFLVKVFSFLSYLMFGRISFGFLAFVSSLVPIVFSYALGSYASKKNNLPFYTVGVFTLPVLLLVTQLTFWQAYLWSASALSHGFIPILGFACFFAFENKKYFVSIFFAVLAWLSAGIGIFFVVLMLIPFMCSLFKIVMLRGLRWKIIFLLLIVFIIGLLFIYCDSNELLHERANTFFSLSNNLSYILKYGTAFLGNVYDFQNFHFYIMVGALGIFLYCLSFRKVYFTLHSLALIPILSAFASAILHVDVGIEHAINSRYGIYSTTFFSILVIIYLLNLKHFKQTFYFFIIILFGYFFLSSYSLALKKIENHKLKQNMEFISSRYNKTDELAFYPRWATDIILNKSRQLGVYDPYTYKEISKYIETDFKLGKTDEDITYKLDSFFEDDQFIYTTGFAFFATTPIIIPNKICLLLVKNDQHESAWRSCMPIKIKVLQPDEKKFIKTSKDKLRIQFELIFPKEVLRADNYKVGLQLRKNRHWFYKFFDVI